VIGDLTSQIVTNPWLSPFIVFFAGLLTASNPCVLVLVPLMVGASGAYQGSDKSPSKAVKFSICFIVGLSVSMVVLGLLAGLVGDFISLNSRWFNFLISFLIILMGLMFADIVKINIPVPAILKKPRTGLFGAFTLGLLFGFISTPCTVPVLGVILALIAEQGSIALGGFLLFMYGLGHSVLLLVAGISIGTIQAYINNKRLTKASSILRIAFGLIITCFGLYLLWLA
jgi:cytochrome c-type biogenesis protein